MSLLCRSKQTIGNHHFKWNLSQSGAYEMAVDVPAPVITSLQDVPRSDSNFFNIRVVYIETLQETGEGDRKSAVYSVCTLMSSCYLLWPFEFLLTSCIGCLPLLIDVFL